MELNNNGLTYDQLKQQYEQLLEEVEAYKRQVARMNGSNLIFENKEEKILFGKSKFPDNEGIYRYMLPGGGIERGEMPRHAGVTETMEETYIPIDEDEVLLVGVFLQRVRGVPESNGVLFLYLANKFECEPKASNELSEYRYFSHSELIDLALNKDQKVVGLGYLRLACHYIRWKQSTSKRPIEARLSDKVAISRDVNSPLINV